MGGGVSVREIPVRQSVGGMHPTVMHSCCMEIILNSAIYLLLASEVLLPSATKLRRLCFLHLSVILFTGGSTWAGAPPRDQVPPGTRYTPLGSGTPWDQVHSPRTRYTPLGPGAPSPRDQVHPPGTRYTADGYGTHPTGMHSCLVYNVSVCTKRQEWVLWEQVIVATYDVCIFMNGTAKIKETRMHSSGMRTAHLLTVSQHALWRGGTCPGCVPVRGVVPAQGGVPARCGGGGVPAQVLPPGGQTDTCKNISFANFVCGR